MALVGEKIRSKCPACGLLATRMVYDIQNGSGPELSCIDCEWCWGADGQDLKPLDVQAIRKEMREHGVPWL